MSFMCMMNSGDVKLELVRETSKGIQVRRFVLGDEPNENERRVSSIVPLVLLPPHPRMKLTQ